MKLWTRVASVLLVALSASCIETFTVTPDGGGVAMDAPPASDATPSGTGGSLPCDVEAVLQQHCQSCHASTPVAGAPMPLMTWDDTQRPARSDPSVSVWQMMQRRVHSTTNPMPPTGMLSAAELATLDGWFGSMAPGRDGGSCASDDASAPASDAGPVGPSALPCDASSQRTFLAHASGSPTAPFHVAQDAGNLYQCFTFASPFASATEATAFAPVIDDARVVHHWILYQTATAQPDGAIGPCHMPNDARFVAGWAPGGGNNVFPSDVGEVLPTTGHGWFILQLHYWNVAGYTDADDRSGVAMCTTTTPRAHTAAVVALGPVGIAIPPHTTGFAVQGRCTDRATTTLHLISTFPHMHTHGTAIRTEILRGGDPAHTDTLVDVPRWDFNTQQQYPTDTTISPGDVLHTTCTYSNMGDTTVTFGENTENEMCFDFVTLWPAEAITSGGTQVTYCNDP